MASTSNIDSRVIGSAITEPIHSDESNGPEKCCSSKIITKEKISLEQLGKL